MPRKKSRDPAKWDAAAGARMRAYFTRARGEFGFSSDAELWNHIGVGRDTAQAWMRGERPPRRDVGQRVAERLGISYAALLAIHDGTAPDVDAASVIRALEWALTKVRSGEWTTTQRGHTAGTPAAGREWGERVVARSTRRRSQDPSPTETPIGRQAES